eukprot:TRINITY_DN4942_c4_g2_i1.p1 TRINITY_DN4942_c4_g2~~TRINITY_DN4942_c4_g2_i1.p1  ORF type:complete len:300 (-),score=60.86 TRINITY_DN4942_c4_g2_i1:151-1011(-)
MGTQESKPLPPRNWSEYEPIPIETLSEPSTTQHLLQELGQEGFVILRLDDDLMNALLEFIEASQIFFEQTASEKEAYTVHDPLRGRLNQGYILVDRIKEFLKFKAGDELPDVPPHLADRFDQFIALIHPLAESILDLIAETETEEGTKYMDETLYKQVKEMLPLKSAVAMISYYPRLPPEERDQDDPPTYDEDGLSIPSQTHTDTGLITLISCSDVPGLQVEDRRTGEWIEVEKIADPRRDLFCILGNKIELFAQRQEDTLFKRTVHRVVCFFVLIIRGENVVSQQ